MNTRLFVCAAIAFSCVSLHAAETTNAPARGRGFGTALVSPEVYPDRSVTFRVRAASATNVTVSGEWPGGTKAMTNDGRGNWSVTLGPLQPDLYGYSFSINGFQTIDPANSAVKPMRSPRTSILEVPGNPPLLHEFNASVPHGTVREHWYRSKALNVRRSLHVYTPPGYDKSRKDFPVLYLLHGAGDNDATWTALGRAQVILDNLLAQKKVVPMIVVMTDGHASVWPPSTNTADRARGNNAFENDLVGDVMPFIEENYRIINKRESRAIIGLSMGGGQSLTVGLNHLDRFAWVGAMSAATPDEGAVSKALSDTDTTNKKLKLLWIAIGKDDFLLRRNEEFDRLLMSKGIKHTFTITEGNHSWPVWRRYLAEFAPMLFK
jgi:enterochelin esterase-like enzyme